MNFKDKFIEVKQKATNCGKYIKEETINLKNKAKVFPKEHPIATTIIGTLSFGILAERINSSNNDKTINSLKQQLDNTQSRLNTTALELEDANNECDELEKENAKLKKEIIYFASNALHDRNSNAGKKLNELKQKSKEEKQMRS